MYMVFVRSWWRVNKSRPSGLEPHAGRKKIIRRGVKTIEEARMICQEYNRLNPPGRLSRKAEFTS
jgi:hypothetical protein